MAGEAKRIVRKKVRRQRSSQKASANAMGSSQAKARRFCDGQEGASILAALPVCGWSSPGEAWPQHDVLMDPKVR